MIKKSITGRLIRVQWLVGWDDEIRNALNHNWGFKCMEFHGIRIFDTKEEAEKYRENTVLGIKEISSTFKFIG